MIAGSRLKAGMTIGCAAKFPRRRQPDKHTGHQHRDDGQHKGPGISLSLVEHEARQPGPEWQADDGTAYSVGWRLQVPGLELDLSVQASLDDQLMDHTVQYWEGAVDVSGSHAGRGYLELSGYAGNP